MNLYFLLEGKRTEKKIYPSWLGHSLPRMTEVTNPSDLKSYNYYLLSCEGYPSYLTEIPNAHEDIRQNPNVSHFFICVDAEDAGVEAKLRELREEVEASERKTKVRSANAHFETLFVVQNCCIETWLLGNRRMMATNPTTERLIAYRRFYDVRALDPEAMGKHPDSTTSRRAQFHEEYLCAMFREKHVRYSKNNPGEALKAHYFNELCARAASGHLASFKVLLDAWSTIGNARPTDGHRALCSPLLSSSP